MVCDACGRTDLAIRGDVHEGLNVCEAQCVDWLEMISSMDKRVLASILAAYRSRKATRDKEATGE